MFSGVRTAGKRMKKKMKNRMKEIKTHNNTDVIANVITADAINTAKEMTKDSSENRMRISRIPRSPREMTRIVKEEMTRIVKEEMTRIVKEEMTRIAKEEMMRTAKEEMMRDTAEDTIRNATEAIMSDTTEDTMADTDATIVVALPR